MDLRRAFTWRFWALSIGVAVLFGLNMINYPFYGTEDLVYRMFIGGDQFFLHAMLIVSTAVYGMSFCEDWDNRNIRNVYIRAGARRYAASKVLSCALSATAALFVGKLIFVLAQLPLVPALLQPETFAGAESPAGSMDMLAYHGNVILWLFLNLLRFALEGAGFAVLSLAVSTVLTNKFIVLMAPIFMYFTYDFVCLYLHFPPWLNLQEVYESVYSATNAVLCMLYPFVLSSMACLIFGWLFYRGVHRRFENG